MSQLNIHQPETPATSAGERATLPSFFNQKTQPITLRELRRSRLENDVKGNPMVGIHHVELIDRIAAIAEDRGFTPRLDDLFVAQNPLRQAPGVSLLPDLEARYGERAIEAHIFRRVFCAFTLPELDDGERGYGICLAYHQRGIQLAVGSTVHLCHNQTILHADQLAATYVDSQAGLRKEDQLNVPSLLSWLERQLRQAGKLFERDGATIQRLRERQVTPAETLSLLGQVMMMKAAGRVDPSSIPSDTPAVFLPTGQPVFSLSSLLRLAGSILMEPHGGGEMDAWRLYNLGTSFLHPTNTEIPTLLPQVISWSQLLARSTHLA